VKSQLPAFLYDSSTMRIRRVAWLNDYPFGLGNVSFQEANVAGFVATGRADHDLQVHRDFDCRAQNHAANGGRARFDVNKS